VYTVTVSMRGDLLRTSVLRDSAGLIDILWAHALPGDGLEHIAKHISDDMIDINLFVKSDSPENAYKAAVRICRSALSTSAALADWRLIADDQPHGVIRISQSG
jgi:hypothetical protein